MKDKKSVKKKIIMITSILLIVIIVACIGLYKASDYAVTTLFKSLMVQELENQLPQDTTLENSNLQPDIVADTSNTDKTADSTINKISNTDNKKEKQNTIGLIEKNRGNAANQQEIPEETEQAIEIKVDEVVKAIPHKDKRAMLGLITNNISGSDMGHLISLVKDGISNQDIIEAKQVAIQSFTPQQLEEVQAYYYKYAHLVPRP